MTRRFKLHPNRRAREQNRVARQIARAYGLPAHLVGLWPKSRYGSYTGYIAWRNEMYYQHSVMPRLERYRASMSFR